MELSCVQATALSRVLGWEHGPVSRCNLFSFFMVYSSVVGLMLNISCIYLLYWFLICVYTCLCVCIGEVCVCVCKPETDFRCLPQTCSITVFLETGSLIDSARLTGQKVPGIFLSMPFPTAAPLPAQFWETGICHHTWPLTPVLGLELRSSCL